MSADHLQNCWYSFCFHFSSVAFLTIWATSYRYFDTFLYMLCTILHTSTSSLSANNQFLTKTGNKNPFSNMIKKIFEEDSACRVFKHSHGSC